MSARTDATILLIDDDPAVLESLHRVLANDGWNVVTAQSGAEGLERLRERTADLVITDLRMAGINGWDIVFHESMEHPRLPIFVISALPAELTGGAARCATEFFQKPLDIDALLASVRRHLGDRSSPRPKFRKTRQ